MSAKHAGGRPAHMDYTPLFTGEEMRWCLRPMYEGDTVATRNAWTRRKMRLIGRWAKNHGIRVDCREVIGDNGWELIARRAA